MKALTRPGRLAAVDAWLLQHEAALLQRAEARVIDVGFGASTVTTQELFAAARGLNPAVEVIGVEREASFVETAPRLPGLSFQTGDFALVAALKDACVVRTFNVLRGLTEADARTAHEALLAPLVAGGVCLEGSTDTEGHVTVFHVLRNARVVREALVFHTDFSRGFGPWLFRDWLPRDLRRSVRPGSAIHAFFDAWTEAFEKARESTQGARELFAATSALLSKQVRGVVATPWHVAHGYLEWRPPGGVPTALATTRCG